MGGGEARRTRPRAQLHRRSATLGRGFVLLHAAPAAPAALPLAGRLSLLLASLNAAQGRPVRFWARAATVFRTGPRCRRCPGSGGEGLDAF